MAIDDRRADLLEARGLDVELLERLGVTNSDRGRDWISIPYFDARTERAVNHKYRTVSGSKQFEQDTGGKQIFWNEAAISDATLASQPLVITEGEFDAISAIQCGFVRAVSVPNGAPAEAKGADDSGTKYAYIAESKNDLREVREIILATDNDGPGINLMNDLAIRLGKHRCKWVRYPVGCKDLNDALNRYGARGVVETLNRAQWIKVAGVYRMSELPPLAPQPAYSTGIDGMDEHFKVRPGDFIVVTGIPSHGKTSWVNELTCHLAELYGWTIAMASFEQRPQIDHRRNLRTYFNRKRVVVQSSEEISTADKWIEKHFAFIVPDEDDDVDLKWVLDRAAAAIIQFDAKMVVVDPWNEMDHIRPPDMSLTEYTGFAIKQFRKLATKYHVPVVVVAHPTKLHPEKVGQPIPIPNLYDISDSSHWHNKADVGIIIHRKDASRTTIRIAKTRYHDAIGEPGDLEGMYLPDQARYQIVENAPPSGDW